MDQFDKAEERARKYREKMTRYQPLNPSHQAFALAKNPAPEPFLAVNAGDPAKLSQTIHLPKAPSPKAPVKRTNEIAMTVYVDGNEFPMTARLNLGDVIGSQRNRAGIMSLLKAALASKFGKVEIT